MLNAYSMRMTSHGLGSEKAVILEKVLSIKFSLKHSISIFAISHYQSLDMGDILLALTKVQIWLISYWHKSPDVALSLLALIKVQMWLLAY